MYKQAMMIAATLGLGATSALANPTVARNTLWRDHFQQARSVYQLVDPGADSSAPVAAQVNHQVLDGLLGEVAGDSGLQIGYGNSGHDFGASHPAADPLNSGYDPRDPYGIEEGINEEVERQRQGNELIDHQDEVARGQEVGPVAPPDFEIPVEQDGPAGGSDGGDGGDGGDDEEDDQGKKWWEIALDWLLGTATDAVDPTGVTTVVSGSAVAAEGVMEVNNYFESRGGRIAAQTDGENPYKK